MGLYIEILSSDSRFAKREWAAKEGVPVSRDDVLKFDFDDPKNANIVPICLVDNGMFDALGVLYNSNEVKAFTILSDDHPKKFFLLDKNKLTPEVGITPELLKAFKLR